MERIKLIFIINNFLIGGVERFIFDLINNLDHEKFEVKVISIMGDGPLQEKFERITVPVFFSGFKKFPKTFIEKLLWLFYLPLNILRIALFLKKEKPQIIITSMYKADIFSLFFPKSPKIISIQHDMVEINPILRRLKIVALKRTSTIIAISNNVKDFLNTFFSVESSKIKVIYNGVDFEHFLSLQKEDKEWVPIFGVIARLEKIKGHIYLLQALKKLKESGKMPQVLFSGDGKERKKIELFLKENSLNNVEILGPKKDIKEVMKKIDVFILPSLSEGLGISLIEALVAKKLLIASEIGGIKELINSKTGILTKPADVNDLYNALNWVLEKKEEAITLRDSSFLWINENRNTFDIKSVSKKYSEVFEELLIKE